MSRTHPHTVRSRCSISFTFLMKALGAFFCIAKLNALGRHRVQRGHSTTIERDWRETRWFNMQIQTHLRCDIERILRKAQQACKENKVSRFRNYNVLKPVQQVVFSGRSQCRRRNRLLCLQRKFGKKRENHDRDRKQVERINILCDGPSQSEDTLVRKMFPPSSLGYSAPARSQKTHLCSR